MSLILTLIVALMGAWMGVKLKWPAAPMLGALCAVSLFNVVTDLGVLPIGFKVLTQMVAGIFIGTRITKSDVLRLKIMFVPVLMVLTCLMICCLGMGYGIHLLARVNVATGLLATAPGGLVDITLISDDLGADSAAVSVFQVARLLTVIGLFPILVQHLFVRFKQEDVAQKVTETTNETVTMKWQDIALTLGVAIVCGGIGYVSQIPAGTLIGSMIGCSALNICFGRAKMPKIVRSGAQLCAGSLIGCNVTLVAIIELKRCLIPALLMIIGYFLINLLLAFMLHRIAKIDFVTAFFACAPGGASDMTLMSADFGANMAEVSVFQIIRSIFIIATYPMLVSLLT